MLKLTNWLETFLKYGVAALILAIPLYPKFPFLQVPGTYVSIRLEDFLILVVTVIFFVLVFPKIRDVFRKEVGRAILIYVAVGAVSVFSAIFLTKSVTPHIAFLHLARRIEYFTPFFIGLYVLRKNVTNLLPFFLKLFIIVVIAAGIYGIGQKYLSWPVIVTQNEEYAKGIALKWIPGSHINSTFAGHYDLATFLVMILPILIGLLVLLRDIRMRLILFVAITFGYWLLANAISRISVVSFLGATTISLVLIKKYKAVPVFLLISLVVFGFSSGLRDRYGRIIEVVEEKVGITRNLNSFRKGLYAYAKEAETFSDPVSSPVPTLAPAPVFEDRSTSIRLNVEWPRSLRAFYKNPLLGTGYSSITLATDNDYLRMLGETGILGFLAFFLIFLRIGKVIVSAIPLSKERNDIEKAFLAGFFGGLTGVFLNAFFIDIFEASKLAVIFWLLAGMAVSLIGKEQYE
jgi:hypothetical protein